VLRKKKEILARAGIHKNQMLNVGDFHTVRSRRVSWDSYSLIEDFFLKACLHLAAFFLTKDPLT
jgi:hypothetical protein